VNTPAATTDSGEESGGLPSAALWLLAACIIPWAVLEAMFFMKNRNASKAGEEAATVMIPDPVEESTGEAETDESSTESEEEES